MANNKIRVALLVGGDSTERPVSFLSARAMAAALDDDRYAVTAFDVALPETRVRFPEHLFLPVACLPLSWDQMATALRTLNFDLVLPALHGGWGEDGTLQSLLDVAGVPYAGSAAHASTIAIDKQLCKACLREYDIPVPRGRVVATTDEATDALAFIGLPCVIKPNDGGSSLGVTLIRESAGADAARGRFAQAITSALAHGNSVLVEQLIEGIEVTAAVLGEGSGARALPLIEIVPLGSGDFYDYEAKYAAGGSEHLIPPRLPASTLECISDYAMRAHRALGCRDVSRSDYIVTSDGTAYFLEINTLPGMTATSLVPDAARAAGMSFAALVESLVEAALKRG